MLSPVVARRYAEALLDAALGAGALAEVESDVESLHSAILSNPAIGAALTDPTADPAELRAKVYDPVAAKLRSRLVKNTVALVLDRKRAEVLLQLPAIFRRIALESRGEAEGVVEASSALSAEELRAAELAASSRVQRKVKLTMRIAPDLLGGLRITVGSKRYDATLRSRLAELRERLLAAPLF